MTREVNLYKVIESLDEYDPGKNIECKYFTVTFYKKGTCRHHIHKPGAARKVQHLRSAEQELAAPELWENQVFRQMSAEEQAIVAHALHRGADAYARVMAKATYYLGGEGLPALTA